MSQPNYPIRLTRSPNITVNLPGPLLLRGVARHENAVPVGVRQRAAISSPLRVHMLAIPFAELQHLSPSPASREGSAIAKS